MFGRLKEALRGQRFVSDEVEDAVHMWLRSQPKTWLVNRCITFAETTGVYADRWRILHLSQIIVHEVINKFWSFFTLPRTLFSRPWATSQHLCVTSVQRWENRMSHCLSRLHNRISQNKSDGTHVQVMSITLYSVPLSENGFRIMVIKFVENVLFIVRTF
jgi:hypothetical protein